MENIEEHIQRLSETLSSIKKDLPEVFAIAEPTMQPTAMPHHPMRARKTLCRSYDHTMSLAVSGDLLPLAPSRDLHAAKRSRPADTAEKSL